MKKVKIAVTGEIELAYNEKSKDFKEALDGYRDCIERNGSKESMLLHVAFYVNRFGTDGMVEGVGYVGFNGRKPKEGPYSGIMVSDNYDEFSFEID